MNNTPLRNSINLSDIAENGMPDLPKSAGEPHLCELVVPLDGYLRNHIDVAYQYLEIAFIGHQLSKVAKILAVDTELNDPSSSIQINLQYENPGVFCRKLLWLSYLYRDSDEMDDTEATGEEYNVTEAFVEFEDFISNFNCKANIALPDFVDKYFANFIASNYDWSEEEKHVALKRNPEWAFHVWKSAYSPKIGFDLFVSPTFWLLSNRNDLLKAVANASDLNTEQMYFLPSVDLICDRDKILIFTKTTIIELPLSIHLEATRAAEVIFPFEDDPFWNSRYLWALELNFEIANDLSCLKCAGGSFNYVVFRKEFSILSAGAIKKLTSKAQNLVGNLLDRCGNIFLKKCNWSLLNNETFEILCYDIILCDSRFNKSKTKKMGNSRSRDGGRDIVTETVSRAGQFSKEHGKWIIQCKFSMSKKSLGRNEVNVSEIIDEYSPDGIIIATNIPIDAGTYDKYERIQENRKVSIECWDGLYIERFLNQNLDIWNTYFNTRGDGEK
ncbi:MAG: hypothetical protein HYS21_09035 [Deltaproteobacteria bacterium]|nr:hypothetical protein [Deltaproteobacteria bacterium]